LEISFFEKYSTSIFAPVLLLKIERKLFICSLLASATIPLLKDTKLILKYCISASFNDSLKFLKEEFDDVKLSSAEILVRIFQTEKNYELTNNIAEYTNSQNAVSSINLKSISNIQIELERYLKQEGILYIRKSGDTGLKLLKNWGELVK